MIIEINTDVLNSDIIAMQTRLEALTNAKLQVFRCLSELNGMWVGSAHEAFVLQTQNDSEELEALLKNLSELIDCITYAKQEYVNCDQDVGDKIAAMQLSSDY